MNILERIIADKQQEVVRRKAIVPIAQLETTPDFGKLCVSMAAGIRKHPEGGVIAEFKRKSPSKGIIRSNLQPLEVAKGYRSAGAAGMSILTDTGYFGGTTDDLREVTAALDIPVLRKDFIIDDYQVYETKAMGADVVLLIAANLTVANCHRLTALAVSLGLEVLLELHSESELGHLSEGVTMVGINNRDLRTFKVDLEHAVRMAAMLPGSMIRIAESGISDVQNALYLRDCGFNGFLIGEYFMKQEDPGNACRSFIQALKG